MTNGEEVWSDTVMCDIEGSDHVFYFDNGSDPDYITHWQPLPQPPKAE
nr:DUF551 domain-containing protein [Wielerella bovis]